MRTFTKLRTGALLLLFTLLVTGSATAQALRTVTLTLNAATTADTTKADSFFEVRGAADGTAPATLADGNIIDWGDASTLEPVNIGGDYWQVTFQIADTTDLQFKFYSGSMQDNPNIGEGWEAEPNPTLADGSNDTTFAVHFFESQREFHGVSGDRGPYDWRPWEVKEDTIAVWFRVYMNTSDGITAGYVPAAEAPAQQIGVRGDDFTATGPLDWGATKVLLDRESSNAATPGYNLYSGVAYYPASMVGMTQAYKFVRDNDVLTDDQLGWENGTLTGNRTFTIPAQDTTLAWQFFGNTPAAKANPVTSNVLFAVNLDAYESIGVFRKSRGDTLQVRGSFNDWGCGNPDLCLLSDVPATNDFEAAVTLTLLPQAEIAYKFYLDFNNDEFMNEFGVEPPSGWEEGFKTGVNRVASFEAQPEQDLGVAFFNQIESRNVIPDGTTINIEMSVDMSTSSSTRPFDPGAGDSVYVEINDPIWAFTQGIDTFIDDGDRPDIAGLLTDVDQNGVYTGTLVVEGPTYGLLTLKYKYGQRTNGVFEGFTEAGGGLGNNPGRNRAYFIKSNPDGSWPSTYSLGEHTFQPEGALPFETNTVAVEQVGSDLPAAVTLQPNYPNPFSSSTSFEYTLTDQSDVRLSVYNVIGQKVAVVVDAVQPAGTFKANFEAGTLSSGTYFVRLEAGNQTITRSIVLVK
ncbi:MAG: T9SS type A sorting domain-containing protein [Rhodothermales bacterium]